MHKWDLNDVAANWLALLFISIVNREHLSYQTMSQRR